MIKYNNIAFISLGIACLNEFQFKFFRKRNESCEKYPTPFDWNVMDIDSIINYMNCIEDGTIFDVIKNKNNYKIIKNQLDIYSEKRKWSEYITYYKSPEDILSDKLQNVYFGNFYYWHDSFKNSFDEFIQSQIDRLNFLLKYKNEPIAFFWQNVQPNITINMIQQVNFNKQDLILTSDKKAKLEEKILAIFPKSKTYFIVHEELNDNIKGNNVFFQNFKPSLECMCDESLYEDYIRYAIKEFNT